MTIPCFENDYSGSRGEWLHHHKCPECNKTGPRRVSESVSLTACGIAWSSGKTHGAAYRRIVLAMGRDGYLWIPVRLNGVRRKVALHREMARLFLDSPPNDGVKYIVCHIDGDSNNCAAHNLRWGTHKDNARDREMHGRTARNERNAMARHTSGQVEEARALLAAGHTQREVAARFRCSQATIWRWAHGARRPDQDALLSAWNARPVTR